MHPIGHVKRSNFGITLKPLSPVNGFWLFLVIGIKSQLRLRWSWPSSSSVEPTRSWLGPPVSPFFIFFEVCGISFMRPSEGFKEKSQWDIWKPAKSSDLNASTWMLPLGFFLSELLSQSRSLKLYWLPQLSSTTNNPLPSKISGNVRLFVFYKNMYSILFYVKRRAQQKLPGPQKGVISRSLKFLMQKDGRRFIP